jgi:chromosome segregation ATPase
MATSAPEPLKPTAAELENGAGTDEDLLRLRSRLDRELAMVSQKLADAEGEIADMELAVRAQENGSRPKPGAASPVETNSEKITSRIKAVGDGINKIKEWVHKSKDGEAADAPEAKPPSKTPGDLEERLEEALRAVTQEIREREKVTTELDRRLYELQKELIKKRSEEQHVREMQVRMGETKQLSEDLERKMAALDSMVKTYETSTKTDTGIRTKPKEQPAVPKWDDKMQTAINDALKAVAEQEKKVAEIEKELERANGALVEERARQQRIRAMQIRLRQARHFSVDMQRALSGMASSIESLRARASHLLRPDLKAARRPEKPAAAEAAPPPKAVSP